MRQRMQSERCDMDDVLQSSLRSCLAIGQQGSCWHSVLLAAQKSQCPANAVPTDAQLCDGVAL